MIRTTNQEPDILRGAWTLCDIQDGVLAIGTEGLFNQAPISVRYRPPRLNW